MLNLTHEPNNKIEFQEKEYQLDMSFNIVLSVFEVLSDKELSPEETLDVVLFLLTQEELEMKVYDKVEFLKKIFDEQIGDLEKETFIERDLMGNPMPVSKKAPPYSFKHDSEFIFASFMQAYKVDLVEKQGILHWKCFKALLAGLPENTIFRKVVSIRLQDLPSGKGTEEQRKELQKLKMIYKLPED